MKNFIKMVLKYHYTFIVMALFILIMGIVTIVKTPIDIFPEINTPVVTAVWTYTGMPAKDIERRIVTIAERAYASSVNDIEHIESQSLLGVGVIRIFLHPGANINTGITQVSAASQVCMRSMPAGIMPPDILKYTPTTIPVLQVIISSSKLPLRKVTDIAQNNIKVQLTKVEGTQVPLPMGGKVRQIMVDLDMQKMEARGLTPADVTRAVAGQNVIIPSGNTKIGDKDYIIQLNNATPTVEEMNNFPIKSPKTNEVVYLSDVAYIHDGNAIQTNIVRENSMPGSLMTVYKAGAVSSLNVVSGVKNLLPTIAKTIPESSLPLTIPSDKIPAAFLPLTSTSLGHFILASTPYTSNIRAKTTDKYWVIFAQTGSRVLNGLSTNEAYILSQPTNFHLRSSLPRPDV